MSQLKKYKKTTFLKVPLCSENPSEWKKCKFDHSNLIFRFLKNVVFLFFLGFWGFIWNLKTSAHYFRDKKSKRAHDTVPVSVSLPGFPKPAAVLIPFVYSQHQTARHFGPDNQQLHQAELLPASFGLQDLGQERANPGGRRPFERDQLFEVRLLQNGGIIKCHINSKSISSKDEIKNM